MGVSGALRAKYLLPWCCIHDSLKFDMQNDHVLKKLNFDVWTFGPHSLSQPRGWGTVFDQKSRLICFLFIVTLSACEISVKILRLD